MTRNSRGPPFSSVQLSEGALSPSTRLCGHRTTHVLHSLHLAKQRRRLCSVDKLPGLAHRGAHTTAPSGPAYLPLQKTPGSQRTVPVLSCLTHFSEHSVLRGHRRGRRWQDVLPSSGEVVPRCVSAACLVCPVIKDGHGLSLALAVVNNATFYQGGCSDYVAGTQTQGGEGPLAAYLIAGLRR